MANELDTNLSVLESFGEISFIEDTGHSLADKVLRKIQDGSYTWQNVVDEFNGCLKYLSGKYNLPELEHIEDVQTDPRAGRIPVPSNYQKNLWYCKSTTHNRPVNIEDTVINVYRKYSILDQSGAVRDVAVKGRYLYYQRVPTSAETLRLVYYRYPTILRTRREKPTCLPAHLVEPLLVNYACKEIFSEIEDGLEGKQVNTQRYDGRFKAAEATLASMPEIIADRHAPIDIPDEMEWGSYV